MDVLFKLTLMNLFQSSASLVAVILLTKIEVTNLNCYELVQKSPYTASCIITLNFFWCTFVAVAMEVYKEINTVWVISNLETVLRIFKILLINPYAAIWLPIIYI